MKDSALINLIKDNAKKLGLEAGSLKGNQATAIRVLAFRELGENPSLREIAELFGSKAFGNDSALRQFIQREVFGVEGKVSKADSVADLLGDLGIDVE